MNICRTHHNSLIVCSRNKQSEINQSYNPLINALAQIKIINYSQLGGKVYIVSFKHTAKSPGWRLANSSAWRQKDITGYGFKYIDRPLCLQTDELHRDSHFSDHSRFGLNNILT